MQKLHIFLRDFVSLRLRERFLSLFLYTDWTDYKVKHGLLKVFSVSIREISVIRVLKKQSLSVKFS